MQLVSNGNKEECSESEPILNQHHNLEGSGEPSFSCEITDDVGDLAVDNNDLQNIQVDETCHLVNADQSQCRICLDSGGLHHSYAHDNQYCTFNEFIWLFDQMKFLWKTKRATIVRFLVTSSFYIFRNLLNVK